MLCTFPTLFGDPSIYLKLQTDGHGDMFAVSGNTTLRQQIENRHVRRAGVQSHRAMFLLSSADKRICSSFAYRESLLLNYITLFPSHNSQTIAERVLEGNQILRSCLSRIQLARSHFVTYCSGFSVVSR